MQKQQIHSELLGFGFINGHPIASFLQGVVAPAGHGPFTKENFEDGIYINTSILNATDIIFQDTNDKQREFVIKYLTYCQLSGTTPQIFGHHPSVPDGAKKHVREQLRRCGLDEEKLYTLLKKPPGKTETVYSPLGENQKNRQRNMNQTAHAFIGECIQQTGYNGSLDIYSAHVHDAMSYEMKVQYYSEISVPMKEQDGETRVNIEGSAIIKQHISGAFSPTESDMKIMSKDLRAYNDEQLQKQKSGLGLRMKGPEGFTYRALTFNEIEELISARVFSGIENINRIDYIFGDWGAADAPSQIKKLRRFDNALKALNPALKTRTISLGDAFYPGVSFYKYSYRLLDDPERKKLITGCLKDLCAFCQHGVVAMLGNHELGLGRKGYPHFKTRSVYLPNRTAEGVWESATEVFSVYQEINEENYQPLSATGMPPRTALPGATTGLFSAGSQKKGEPTLGGEGTTSDSRGEQYRHASLPSDSRGEQYRHASL